MNTPDITIPTVYVMGPTNAGKSTLLDAIRSDPRYSLVEVGKMMRAKYPPEYFRGLGASAHTHTEVVQMCLDGMFAAQQGGARAVFVDGQPRDLEQTKILRSLNNRRTFLVLWAPEDVRTGRAQKRDGNDPSKLELSLKRMRGDCVTLFDVVSHLLMHDEHVVVMDTTESFYDPASAATVAEMTAVRAKVKG